MHVTPNSLPSVCPFGRYDSLWLFVAYVKLKLHLFDLFVEIAQPRLRYGDFAIIQDGARDFWNFKFLTVGTLKRVELHRHAEFCRHRPNRGWDIVIFRFFQDGGRPPSWICNACVGTTHKGHLVVFIIVQNLVGIDAVVFDYMHVYRFREFENAYLRPKIGVFWVLIP